MAPTPSSRPNHTHHHNPTKTPQAKHRLHFKGAAHPSPNGQPLPQQQADHPVEVIGRIRDYPDRKDKPISVFQVCPNRQTLRVPADFGYRDFSLDGISLSEEEDIEGFYKKFVGSRVNGVKLGDSCTIMMYGPTGSGKSHNMFGNSKQPGIVYQSLKDILGEGDENSGTIVQVSVVEIYNEEIYDLLSGHGSGGFGLGRFKGSASKVKLEVMGKKAKNATFLSGTEAGKISKEIQKVEKRRIIKSTLCNERSSRSHCMIILEVPTVGGRLMLVDMAGSENIDQAGQVGFEAKLQTAKINQGNIALKRVVESIANGDSHVPFRDSKLTMLLQDSFEDSKSKILMILCASPDPKEIHKTISTFEYGSKAKCIVRDQSNVKNGFEDRSTLVLGSRIAAMDEFIAKLQMENKMREMERNAAHKELLKREEEMAQLRAKLELVQGKDSSEKEINLKVNERTQFLKSELENKLKECQQKANEFVELGKRRMEEKIWQQQQEVEMLRRRLEEIELVFSHSRDGGSEGIGQKEINESGFAKRYMECYAADADLGMVKSMDLDRSVEFDLVDLQTVNPSIIYPKSKTSKLEEDYLNVLPPKYGGSRVGLSTVLEEEEVEDEEEVKKEVIKEKVICSSEVTDDTLQNFAEVSSRSLDNADYVKDGFGEKPLGLDSMGLTSKDGKDSASSRQMTIQTIFALCGNYREISHHSRTPLPGKKGFEGTIKKDHVFSDENCPPQKFHPLKPFPLLEPVNGETGETAIDLKGHNNPPDTEHNDDFIEVYVKWEASKENPGKFITTLQASRDSSLADLRKLIEIYFGADAHAFTFVVVGDPSGAPVLKEKEASVQVSTLPTCNIKKLGGHPVCVCLRPAKGIIQYPDHLPLSSLENRLPVTPIPCFTKTSSFA